MDLALIIFSLSLLSIILMIVHKMFELKTGKGFLFHELHMKIDAAAKEWHGSAAEKIRFFTVENLKTLGRLLYVVSYRIIRALERRANALYVRFHREMTERAVIRKEGVTPSFFLKNISDYKDKPVQ